MTSSGGCRRTSPRSPGRGDALRKLQYIDPGYLASKFAYCASALLDRRRRRAEHGHCLPPRGFWTTIPASAISAPGIQPGDGQEGLTRSTSCTARQSASSPGHAQAQCAHRADASSGDLFYHGNVSNIPCKILRAPATMKHSGNGIMCSSPPARMSPTSPGRPGGHHHRDDAGEGSLSPSPFHRSSAGDLWRHQPTATPQCLELLGCWGKGKVNRLAEIISRSGPGADREFARLGHLVVRLGVPATRSTDEIGKANGCGPAVQWSMGKAAAPLG